MISKVGTPTQPITVSVRSDLGGTDLASANIQPSEVSSVEQEVTKDLSGLVGLGEGITYYLVVGTAQNDVNNYYHLYDNWDTYDYYADGCEWGYDSSSGWVMFTQGDLYFHTNSNCRPRDDNGHGTHCAGIVGAETGNSSGVAGTCHWVKIMPLKAGDCSGLLNTMDIVEAIYYAVDNGADVISMSYGSKDYSRAEEDALNYAHGEGVALFAASGNSGDTTIYYPAGCDNVVGIGATDNKDGVAPFSTHNDSVDLSAPGADIMSTMPTYTVALNDLGCTRDYSFMSGTSMACPLAAGVAALILSQAPYLYPEWVEYLMREGAEDRGAPGWDDYYGWGRLNACQTIDALSSFPVISDISPSSGKVGVAVTLSGSGFGAAQGTSLVSFGSVATTQYDSWTDSEIVCRVPAMPPGEIEVRVEMDNGYSNEVSFQVLPFSVSCSVTPEGAGTVAGAGTYGYGQEVILAATPSQGYHFLRWTEGGAEVSTQNPYQFTALSDRDLTAVFELEVSPQTSFYFAEGYTGKDTFEEYLCLLNPGDQATTAHITYMFADGSTQEQDLPIAKTSRATVNVKGEVGPDRDVSIRVTSDLPIACERPMYFNYAGVWTGGHVVMGYVP